MKEYSEVREILCELLSDSIKDGKIAIGDVEIIKNMLSGIEKTYKIEMFEDDGGYSQAGDWEIEGRAYNRGNSYARRKRDSMGRYSRDGRMMRGDYRDGRMYSRAEAKDDIMNQIQDMMGDADEKEKVILRRAMTELEKV